MGKKNKSAVASKPAADTSVEVTGQLQSLKEQGNRFFGLSQFAKALDCYDKAIKLLPDGTTDREDFHVKKSACYLKLQKYKEAVKECNSALDVQPASVIALKRRASAFEQQGLYKQALADITSVNKTDAATTETKEAEKRLKDVMAGRNKAITTTNNGAAVRATQRPVSRAGTSAVFSAKCTLNNETRLVHIAANVTYADLLVQVRHKFPDAGHFVLKYVDREGDLVTITTRQDIQKGITEIIQAAGGLNNTAKLAGLPPLKIQVQEVATEAEVPKPPLDEQVEVHRTYQQQIAAIKQHVEREQAQQAQLAQQQQQPQPPPQQQAEQQQETLEIDEWLTDFVDLFAQQTGIDPFRAESMAGMGIDETSKAMVQTLRMPEVEGVLRSAAARFQEATCLQLLNWGNAHQYIGSRALELAASSEAGVTEEVIAKARGEFDEAERRFRDALTFKADFADGHSALATLDFERAKLSAGLLIRPLTKEQQEEIGALEKEAADKAQALMTQHLAANLQAALEGTSKEKLLGMAEQMEGVKKQFERAVADGDAYAKAQADEAAAKGKVVREEVQADGTPVPPQEAGDMMRIMYGNVLYEWSQFLGYAGGEWRRELDAAVALFTDAKCPAKDIRAVLRNHRMAAELDVPAEAEEEAAAPAEAPAAEAPAAEVPAAPAAAPEPKVPEKEAKGLPSLAVKKKADKKK